MEEEQKRGVRELAETVRTLAQSKLDVHTIHQKLKDLAQEFGYGVFAVYLRHLIQLDLTPREGLSLWKELILHHQWVEDKVPGIDYRATFLDYLVRKRNLLKFPVVLERATFDKTMEATFTDEMTKLYNLRFFRQSLERELKRARRIQRTCAVLFLDIDHFKKINDRFGHPVGDEVLKAVAGIIVDTSRITDFPARYGGEEFAILAPDTELPGAILLAERIRKKVEELVLPELRDVRATISIGVACYPMHASNSTELISRADRALYQAKASGRNRVVAYEVNHEKRNHIRHPVRVRGSANSAGFKTKIPFQTKNVSERGLLCEMAASVRVGTSLELELDMGKGRSVKCLTTVVHVKKPLSHNAYEVGFCITSVPPTDEQEFNQFIDWCESHPITASTAII